MYLQNSNYKILQNIGSGSGHQVFQVQNISNSQNLALKIEKNSNLGQLEVEIQKLKELSGINGIPQLIDYGKTKDLKSYLITPLLQRNLQDILKESFISLFSTLAIGLSLIEILQQVHKKGILHLDIKPENIMISQPYINVPVDQILTPGFIQLIDFGLSQKLGQKPFLNKVFVGSLRYASRQAHKGNKLGYKDDLESLLYVLVYLRDCKFLITDIFREAALGILKIIIILTIRNKKNRRNKRCYIQYNNSFLKISSIILIVQIVY
ncbi:unnamed protein product [Paramecium sonneborni]|uniref:Casein kinase I n=1 Tax=Paramecium sonneborni TaxID=65129 RepID=A0A8S1RAY0_9CILI|nr:unnamed protein product [Paramecium sonneborni]